MNFVHYLVSTHYQKHCPRYTRSQLEINKNTTEPDTNMSGLESLKSSLNSRIHTIEVLLGTIQGQKITVNFNKRTTMPNIHMKFVDDDDDDELSTIPQH